MSRSSLRLSFVGMFLLGCNPFDGAPRLEPDPPVVASPPVVAPASSAVALEASAPGVELSLIGIQMGLAFDPDEPMDAPFLRMETQTEAAILVRSHDTLVAIDTRCRGGARFSDERGRAIVGVSRFGEMPWDVRDDGRSAVALVHVGGVLGADATRLHVDGTICVTVATGTVRATGRLPLREGEGIVVGGLELEVSSAERTGDPEWPLALHLDGTGNIHHIVELHFLDGLEEVRSEERGRTFGIFDEGSPIFMLEYAIGRRATTLDVVATLHSAPRVIEVPFHFVTGPGLDPPE